MLKGSNDKIPSGHTRLTGFGSDPLHTKSTSVHIELIIFRFEHQYL